MRFLSGRGVTLSHTFLDDEGDSVTPPSVSVTAYDEDGSQVFTEADITANAGVFSANAGVLPQGLYRVVWAGTGYTDTDMVEVVGAYLFTIRDARESDIELVNVDDYPSAEIRHYREVVETEFQTITGRSFVPRTTRIDIEVDGSETVWLGLFDCNALTALSGPDGALVTSDYRLDTNGLLSDVSGFPAGTILTVTVDYGFRSPPADIKRVALTRLRFLLAAESSGVPDRATSYVAAEGGTYTLATPGRNGYKIGIPEVDATLNLYAYNVLASVLAVG